MTEEAVEAVARTIEPLVVAYSLNDKDARNIAITIARAAIAAMPAGVREPSRSEVLEEAAQWMIQRSYATGHGDTVSDLLAELVAQVREHAFEECAAYVHDLWDNGIPAQEFAARLRSLKHPAGGRPLPARAGLAPDILRPARPIPADDE